MSNEQIIEDIYKAAEAIHAETGMYTTVTTHMFSGDERQVAVSVNSGHDGEKHLFDRMAGGTLEAQSLEALRDELGEYLVSNRKGEAAA